MNVVALVGRLTADPEEKGNEKSTIAKFTLAVDRAGDWNADEKRPDTGFFPITVFGQPATFILEYGKKGSLVSVKGNLRQHRWKTENDEFRSMLEVAADEVRLLGPKSDNGDTEEATSSTKTKTASKETTTSLEEDIDAVLNAA